MTPSAERKIIADVRMLKEDREAGEMPHCQTQLDALLESVVSLAERIDNLEKAEKPPTEIQVFKRFVDRVAGGEKMTAPEDMQFYENNKEAIERQLSAKAKSKAKKAKKAKK